MALGFNPWMTALQAALGGVGGYYGGKAEQEADAEKKRQQAAAEQRQAMMDALMLGQQAGMRFVGKAGEVPSLPRAASRPAPVIEPSALQAMSTIPKAAPAPSLGPKMGPETGLSVTGAPRNVMEPVGTSPISTVLRDRQFQALTQPATTPEPIFTPERREVGGLVFETRPTEDQLRQIAEQRSGEQFEKAIAGFAPNVQQLARMGRVLPSNVLQALAQPKERVHKLEYNKDTGQVIDLDTGEARSVKGAKIAPQTEKPAGMKESDWRGLTRESAFNEMYIAHRNLQNYEQKVLSGQAKITVPEDILRKVAADFKNTNTPLSKAMQSAAYNQLAQMDPGLTEYMRNVDAFAEGEALMSNRASDYRTKMAQFLSGIASGSPDAVVRRVQQRRYGLLSPVVKAKYNGNWDAAWTAATGETDTSGASSGKSLEEEFPGKVAQIKQARLAKYSDDQIRAFLRGK